jgi:tetratricopeptide (TPR) repeat protein
MMKQVKGLLGIRSRRPRGKRRKAGDLARDSRDWQTAADAYGDYLAVNADDWPLWVQRGHCLKEMGDLIGAERSYRLAADLAPRQADPFFHLGSIMKRQNRRATAIDYFQRAVMLGNRDAVNDLRDLGVAIDPDRTNVSALRPWVTVETLNRTLLDARAARDLRRWDEAEALYTTYLQIRPESDKVKLELAFVREARTR